MSKRILCKTVSQGRPLITEEHGEFTPRVVRLMWGTTRLARAIVCDLKEPGAYISHLYVAPAFRRKYWGSYLMGRLFDLAQKANCNAISLHVAKNNKAAQRLYKHCGFFIACTTSDEQDPHYLMVRRL